ncbi:MAG: response regulator [Candidatus Omnitrophica bacterium]|nr:response regulator [Candidatus Omnitrophota bacterium]
MWKVLVVDDNKNNCDLLVSTLDGLAACDVCQNGEDALSAYKKSVDEKSPYQAILLDVAMPGIDGIDVLKSIRNKEEERGVSEGKGVPIFMVTAHKEHFMDAFNIGCTEYILKPIEPDKVIFKLKEKLGE